MNTIQENNKLIAEFMGVFNKILSTGNIHSWSDAPFYYTTEDTKEKVIKNISKYSKYHTDWNWLIEVVQKINDQNNVVQIHENHVMVVNNTKGEVLVDVVSGSMLEATYEAVVEYIKLKEKKL